MSFAYLAVARMLNARHGLETPTTYADLGVKTLVRDVLRALGFVALVVCLMTATAALRQAGITTLADLFQKCGVLLVVAVPLSFVLAALAYDGMLAEEEQARELAEC